MNRLTSMNGLKCDCIRPEYPSTSSMQPLMTAMLKPMKRLERKAWRIKQSSEAENMARKTAFAGRETR